MFHYELKKTFGIPILRTCQALHQVLEPPLMIPAFLAALMSVVVINMVIIISLCDQESRVTTRSEGLTTSS